MAAVAGDAAKPKLSYFNIRGRGECIRLCLRDNEIEYEEDIIGLGSKSFQDLKREGFEDGTLPFGQVPRWKDDEVDMVQMNAILRHIGRKYDLYGKDEPERCRVDQLLDAVEDLRRSYLKVCYEHRFSPEGVETFKGQIGALSGGGGGVLLGIDRFVARNPSGSEFATTEKISVADYALFDMYDDLIRIMPGPYLRDNYPTLHRFHERMLARPNIRAYVDSNPAHREFVNGNRLG